MKVSKVDVAGSKYTVTKVPGILESILGRKTTVENFYETNKTFHHFSDLTAFITEDGAIVGPLDEMCAVLNNAKRKALISGGGEV